MPAGRGIGRGGGEQAFEVRQHLAPDETPLPQRESHGRLDQLALRGVAVGQVAEHASVRPARARRSVAQLCRGGARPDQGESGEEGAHRARVWHEREESGKGGRVIQDHVLFLDGEAIVLDKPAGLPVDPPRDGAISLENHLSHLTFGFRRWPQAVHRLDRDTSGCLLLSRNPKAHARLQQAFEAGAVGKRYLAILDGVPEREEGTIDLPLGKVSSEAAGWRMTGDPRGKGARTAWRLLRVEGGRALVEFRPTTGRTHQIRVHALEGLGVAVVGDPVYGRADPAGMMLHAAELTVPRTGKPAIHAEAPWPERFAAAGFPGG